MGGAFRMGTALYTFFPDGRFTWTNLTQMYASSSGGTGVAGTSGAVGGAAFGPGGTSVSSVGGGDDKGTWSIDGFHAHPAHEEGDSVPHVDLLMRQRQVSRLPGDQRHHLLAAKVGGPSQAVGIVFACRPSHSRARHRRVGLAAHACCCGTGPSPARPCGIHAVCKAREPLARMPDRRREAPSNRPPALKLIKAPRSLVGSAGSGRYL